MWTGRRWVVVVMTGRVAGSSLQVAVAMRRAEMAPCSAYAGEMTVES